ncbi:transposase [Yersinia enterocolitica]|nr:transposase [Yersinia enterocolitica]CND66302.1 transposase [Yersinia enterocolitica]
MSWVRATSVGEKAVEPPISRACSGLSAITACKLTSLSRHLFIDAIHVVLSESPQAGFWKCYYRLRFKGFTFNHKRVYRVYCWLGLNLKRRIKKTLPKRENKPLSVVNRPDIQWALDFMHDALCCGKRFRTLNIIDEGTRECLAI